MSVETGQPLGPLPTGAVAQEAWLAARALQLSNARSVRAGAAILLGTEAPALPTLSEVLGREQVWADRQQEFGRLREVGKRYALAGDETSAQDIRARVQDPEWTDPADEITLAIMEHRLAAGQLVRGHQAFDELSGKFRPWGVIKLQAHGVEVPRWQQGFHMLEDAWRQYDPRQQEEIITDVLALGDVTRALRLTLRVAPPTHNTVAQLQAKRNALIRIAHHQAAQQGDVDGGLLTLAFLETEAEAALNEAIEADMNLPNPPAARHEHAGQAEHVRTYNLAQMHILALLAHQDVHTALTQLEISAFYGDDQRRVFRTMAQRVVANTLAELGRVPEAVTVASGMNEQNGDRVFLKEKALAFLDIGRAVRRARQAAA